MTSSLCCRMGEHLAREYNLSVEQVGAMVEVASNDIKKNLAKIAACVDVDDNIVTALDYDSLRKAAHSLKGVLLNLGLTEEAEEANRIELTAQNRAGIDSVEKILAISRDL